MSIELAFRKFKTGVSIIRKKGIKFLLRFLLNERRHLLWKWHSERYAASFKSFDLVLVERINGFKMLVNPRDAGIGTELIYSHIHEPQVTRLIPCMVRPGDIVLECGANIGYYTLLLSKIVGLKGKVIALEPNPEVFSILQLNLELNGIKNVETHQIAIGGKDGVGRMYLKKASNLSSMLENEGESATDSIVVPVIRLETLYKKLGISSCNMIRMDIEGYEADFLKGNFEFLMKLHPRIVLEYHIQKIGISKAETLLFDMEKNGYWIKLAIPRDEDWPWAKQPARILISPSIKAFLQRPDCNSPIIRTFTLFLDLSRKLYVEKKC